jgi:hypothetical protein
MRSALALVIALAACGGNKTAPTNTTPPDKTAPEKPAGGKVQCCCALPSDPETFDMHDSTDGHEDSHGVCQDDDSKCKK